MKKNAKVKYMGCSEEQYRWGNGRDPRGILIIGQEYIVEDIEIHNWYTLIELKGIEEKFNSVCFL